MGFQLASLITLLAVLAALPIIQLIAFGYLLNVAGCFANGSKFHDAVLGLEPAGRIGLAAIGLAVLSLPTQLLAHWQSVAVLIEPDLLAAHALALLTLALAALSLVYLLAAWSLGGRLNDYCWPASFLFRPSHFMRRTFCWSAWTSLPDRLWRFTASLNLWTYFWLGLRGLVGTLIWIAPALVIVLTLRHGWSDASRLLAIASLLVLGVILFYLPMLQANFAAEKRWSAMFDVRRVRRDFRRSPWAWLAAMSMTLVVFPVPLYLLKIEAVPQAVMWVPCWFFIACALPARIACGMALGRCRRRPEPSGRWSAVSRHSVRVLMPVVVAIYLGIVFASQYTSWDGLRTWIYQHALLIPVPFFSGI